VAAIVAVLGLSSSASAGLLNEISALGTNLLVVENGQTITGGTAELPKTAPPMIGRIDAVTQVQETGSIAGNVFRSPLIPTIDTNAISIDAASLGLPHSVSTSVARGSYLNAATAQEPVAVLGAAAAQRLGIDRVFAGERIWIDNQWFYVAGILKPAVLAPAIESSVLVGFPAAQRYLGFDGPPPPSTCGSKTVRSTLSTTYPPPPPTRRTRARWPCPNPRPRSWLRPTHRVHSTTSSWASAQSPSSPERLGWPTS
jgi:putative ABC transport system permease protein